MFRSLTKLREWMDIPAPKMLFESECNPALLPDAQEQTPDDMSDEQSEWEYYAIKGGSEAGSFANISETLKAKQRSGGAFAVFSSKQEAEKYVRPTDLFVVWAGRQVGIMSKAEWVKAIQRLTDVQICALLSQETAVQKWKPVKSPAQVIPNKTAKSSSVCTCQVKQEEAANIKKEKILLCCV